MRDELDEGVGKLETTWTNTPNRGGRWRRWRAFTKGAKRYVDETFEPEERGFKNAMSVT